MNIPGAAASGSRDASTEAHMIWYFISLIVVTHELSAFRVVAPTVIMLPMGSTDSRMRQPGNQVRSRYDPGLS